MTQGIFPINYEIEKKNVGITSLGGLPLYLELDQGLGLIDYIEKHIKVRPTQ